jgi:succinate dehydrogenase / fumarate reductase, cytochrome b subunit
MPARPLSPHVTVYRFAYTMTLSFLHRLTGIALAAGLLLLACWLMAAASGPGPYARLTAFLGQGLLQVVLGAWLVAFVYHLGAGVRHLFWDAGYGFERAQARRSGTVLVVAVAIVATLLLYLFFCPTGVHR